MRWVLMVAVLLGACGSPYGAGTRAGEPEASPAPAPRAEPQPEPPPTEEAPVTEPQPAPTPPPAPPPAPEPDSAGGGIGASPQDDPSCGEDAENACQMRGGNCRLVLDSPCVGRGTRCRDFEMQSATGCRCYCQPVDSEGRPVLPR